MDEQKSLKINSTKPEVAHQKRTFQTTMEKLMSALRNRSKPTTKSLSSSTQSDNVSVERSPQLDEIEKQMKLLPEAEIMKAGSPEVIRETPMGIVRSISPISPIPYLKPADSSPIKMLASDSNLDKFEDASDKFEDNQIKDMSNEPKQEENSKRFYRFKINLIKLVVNK